MSTDLLSPRSEAEICTMVKDAAAARAPIEIIGGGTRRSLGRPVQAARTMTTSGLSGISLYEPGALTIVAAAGTPMAEIEGALQSEGQRLPFEPMDHRALLGTTGEPTIGAVVACNISGPRRIQAGACRDSLIGIRFVNGEGEAVKNGGRVMKNVTGYDLVKLMCGSYGTLGVLTEVAFKVLPETHAAATLTLDGLSPRQSVQAMSAALGSPFEITGAAHDPQAGNTMLRLEGFEASIAYRTGELTKLLAPFGTISAETDLETVRNTWANIRDAKGFAGQDGAVWRVSVKPSNGPDVAAAMAEQHGAKAMFDWGGGLVWLLVPETGDAGAETLRAQTAAMGGHATLVRGSDAIRAAVPVFEPQSAPLEEISRSLRAKFDPLGVLNPGRMAA